MKPTTQAEYDALYTNFYGEACAAHVEEYHLHKSLELSRYVDYHNNWRAAWETKEDHWYVTVAVNGNKTYKERT